MMKNRFKALAIILLVLTILFAGCAPTEVDTNDNNNAKGPNGDEVSEEVAQELIVAFGQDIVTFDAHNYRGGQDIVAGSLVYETLIEFDQDNEIIPALAEDWEWLSPNELQLNLRKDVKFHDGKNFTAEDVKFSIERSNQGTGAAYSNFVTEVRIIDDHTVVCYMEEPFGAALSSLANHIVAMKSHEWVDEIGDKIVEKANGTGPYILKEFDIGSKAVFEKNPNYWGEEPALDRIEFRPIPETGTRVMALKSGEVDVIENPPPQEVASIDADSDLYMYTSPKLRTLYLGFNLKDDHVGGSENKALREAIAYAIDTEELAVGVLEGLADPSHGDFYPPDISQGYSDLSYVRDFDLEKAKQIVADNNLEGTKISVWTTRGRYLLDTEVTEALQAQLSRIGIDAEITVMEYGPMMTAVTEWQQECHQLAWGWNAGDAGVVFNQIFHRDGAFNNFGYQNEEFDNLVKEGTKFPDLKDRMEYYNKALKMIIEDEAIMVPLIHYKNVYAANNKVQGLYATPTEVPLFKYAYIK